jgi:hypothetical protein
MLWTIVIQCVLYLYGTGIFYQNVLFEGNFIRYKNKICKINSEKTSIFRNYKYNTLRKRFESVEYLFVIVEKHPMSCCGE